MKTFSCLKYGGSNLILKMIKVDLFFRKIISRLKIKKFLLIILSFYAKLYPNQIIQRNGIKYEVNLSKLIDAEIFLGGWEKSTITFLKQNLKYGDSIIEVGANNNTNVIGSYRLEVADVFSHITRGNKDVRTYGNQVEFNVNEKKIISKGDVRYIFDDEADFIINAGYVYRL